MKKFKGFTLAEILIAMTVLGIVVAASVPVILNMRPNKNAIMMRKAYYATETIINSLINDSYYYPETDNSDTEGFKNTTKVTVDSIDVESDKKLGCLFASKLNIKENLGAKCAISPSAFTPVQVTTMDGMVWDLTGLSTVNASGNGYIRIDVDNKNDDNESFFYVEQWDGGDSTLYTPFVPGGTCPSVSKNYYSWAGTCKPYHYGEKAAKKFDRMLINVYANGRLDLICGEQTELCAIVSGERSLFKGDND